MEQAHVTPIKNSIRDAVAEISQENQRLHRENQRYRQALEYIRIHAALDVTERRVREADRYLRLADEALDAGT